MIQRLRLRVQDLLSRLRRPRPVRRQPGAPRGRMRNVIVVKPADPRFQEAIFVLRDDYFADPDCDRAELLQEAREAASRETGQTFPPGPRLPIWPAALLLLGAAAILLLTGVIG